ncbi:MAG TPA: insulinase family protein [Vicinamibacteria bacterium]|nr:insulinase family protein [Vicinamibacteria bacterium]
MRFLAVLGLALAAPLLAEDAPRPRPQPAAASAATTRPYRLEEPLPFDLAVRRGTLANGISYYVRRNARPDRRAVLRLAVDAGSVMEQEDQRGLAHMLEHMAFNGSRHFAPGELVSFLESIGARFGADANAYTSFDETVYMLEVPTDRAGMVEKGLTALADFAGGWTLSDEEIEKERGVVLEEWRLGQGVGSRLQRQQLPVLFHGSRYAERLPIGDPDVIRTFTRERLHAFARDWYRPDRMAVVVVGDVDPEKAERWIRERLGKLPAAAGAARPDFEIPGHDETLVNVATDPEARVSGLSVIFKYPRLEERTVGDYRRRLVETLFHAMVNSRLAEMARREDAPYLAASSSGGALGRSVETEVLSAVVPDAGVPAGLRALLTETERIRRHGFAAAELDRARSEMLARYERAWHEREKSESGSYAREYVSHFLTGEPSPGIDVEVALVRQMLPTVTLDEVRDVTARLLRTDNRVVFVVAPQKEGVAVPTEAEVRGVLASATRVEVTPWVDRIAGRRLLEHPPAGGTVVRRRRVDAVGATVLTLSNGVEVWLKPTDFKNDQILFGADALGGASLATPPDVLEALLAPLAVGEMGAGGFTPVELDKLLAGKLVQVNPEIHHYSHGLSGSSTPADLETALQLVYLEFTAPNDRPEGFEVLRRRLATAVAHRESDPGQVYGDAITSLNTGDHYMYRPLRPDDVPALEVAKSLRFYRDRFASAADFRFVFVGSLDPAAVEPLIARYLGGLPSTGRPSSRIEDGAPRFPQGVRKLEVRKGREPRATTTLTFFADAGGSEAERQQVQTAVGVLRNRLRGLLREEMSGTYGVSVAYSDVRPAQGYGTITISFGSSPDNAPRLAKAVFEELDRLQSLGPAAEEVAREQEIERRELEVAQKQNGYWLGALRRVGLIGRDPAVLKGRRALIDAATPERLQQAFRRYFPFGRYTAVTLMPERGPAAGE